MTDKPKRGQPQTGEYLTPEMYAKKLGVSHDKVLVWINRRELYAVNVSNAKRPRWRIPVNKIAEFEKLRSNQMAEPVQAKPRRRRLPQVKRIFS